MRVPKGYPLLVCDCYRPKGYPLLIKQRETLLDGSLRRPRLIWYADNLRDPAIKTGDFEGRCKQCRRYFAVRFNVFSEEWSLQSIGVFNVLEQMLGHSTVLAAEEIPVEAVRPPSEFGSAYNREETRTGEVSYLPIMEIRTPHIRLVPFRSRPERRIHRIHGLPSPQGERSLFINDGMRYQLAQALHEARQRELPSDLLPDWQSDASDADIEAWTQQIDNVLNEHLHSAEKSA